MVIFGSYAPSLVNFRGPLIAALVARGHEIHALASDMDADVRARLIALGAKPHSVPVERSSINPFKAARTSRRLTALLRHIRPDLVLAYTIKPVVLGTSAARAASVPRFVALITGLGYAFTGGREPHRLLSRLSATFLYRRAFKRTDLAVFQNRDDREDFRRLKLVPRHLRTELVAGSGVDLHHFSMAPMPAAPCFLMIARLVVDKGIREFAEAALRLKRALPHVPVLLVGSNDGSTQCISQRELELMIEGGVEYLGPLADVRPVLARASIYVLPSYREGTPRSVLEAMAMGRAIITTDTAGCRETVVHGSNGLLVPPRNASALHDAMFRLAQDATLVEQMGTQSRRIAEERYDVHKVNADLIRHMEL